jgi:hypothetical protein
VKRITKTKLNVEKCQKTKKWKKGNYQIPESDSNLNHRKQQTRAASKTYRQRKKVLESDLFERVEKLESEKRYYSQ